MVHQDNTYTGKMIVFEGIDGSGKATQTEMLFSRLRENGEKVEKIAFPRYGEVAAEKIEHYLAGKMGDMGVKDAAKLYAYDRKDASELMYRWLIQGKTIIVDRYVASNMGHQGGKIQDKGERRTFFEWLYEYEYATMSIPKPDVQIFLDVKPQASGVLRKQDTHRKGDIHENNTSHLENAYDSYQDFITFSQTIGDSFLTVQCESSGGMRPIDAIHNDVWRGVRENV
ncbi:MAG: hypothetical protein F4X82_03305 [Candidatus Spechtbacteria bacterium SB0662_bin_43]|uniref:Thymidylate kinase n=1 Tax=Candidatus Spechtbacteria bacterium SB0662_bin_43 TaxID=2604897 RepID=A0A845DK07_9BACT|nr:hypothetical protein [Candidatus Spechtbacteria bacterium SB0662_bin_43]